MAKKANTKQMGKRKSFDFILVAVVLAMVSLGVIMVLSASSPSSLAKNGNSYEYVKTQGIAAVGGIIFMFILSKIDYKTYKMFDKIGYAVTIVLLLAVLIPGVGLSSGGATRWILLRTTKFTTIRNCKNYISYIFCIIFNRQ